MVHTSEIIFLYSTRNEHSNETTEFEINSNSISQVEKAIETTFWTLSLDL